MNVVINRPKDQTVIVRYEIHLAGEDTTPPEQAYFDEAWKRAFPIGSSMRTVAPITVSSCSCQRRSTRRRASRRRGTLRPTPRFLRAA